jgi:hypothetical protein
LPVARAGVLILAQTMISQAEISGVRALYEMHLRRFEGVRSGVWEHAYSPAQIVAFEQEAARLKAEIDVQQGRLE